MTRCCRALAWRRPEAVRLWLTSSRPFYHAGRWPDARLAQGDAPILRPSARRPRTLTARASAQRGLYFLDLLPYRLERLKHELVHFLELPASQVLPPSVREQPLRPDTNRYSRTFAPRQLTARAEPLQLHSHLALRNSDDVRIASCHGKVGASCFWRGDEAPEYVAVSVDDGCMPLRQHLASRIPFIYPGWGGAMPHP